MIVVTSVNNSRRHLIEGDEFCLTVTDAMGCEVMIRETITVAKVIDYIASYRFALEDGTCPGFHLSGVFANQAELPEELRNAKLLEDLTPEQYANFERSVGVKIERSTSQAALLDDIERKLAAMGLDGPT